MRTLLPILLSLFLCLPAKALDLNLQENHSNEYKAVFFACADHFKSAWILEEVDLFYDANSWKDLSEFVKKVKAAAGSRPILIDIDSHGDTDGFLYLEDDNGTPADPYDDKVVPARMDDVLKQLNKLNNKVVLFEACFSGHVYNTTNELKIDYPVYGVGYFYNYGNGVWIQYTREEWYTLKNLTLLKSGTCDEDEDSAGNLTGALIFSQESANKVFLMQELMREELGL